MTENSILLTIIDKVFKPDQCFKYSNLEIKGFRLIASKEDQQNAGYFINPEVTEAAIKERKRQFGPNPIKPYKDYFGEFVLETNIVPEVLSVKFAIGYTINSKVTTVDDLSNFGWLRLCTGIVDIEYPNLAHHKQLLDYLLQHSKKPRFLITRIYHYLQFSLYQQLTAEISEMEHPLIQP
ncbi:MAG TPA: hypothetical protein PLZ08_10570 [Bacillota bacterium]|nr:hypothetical protein [Bacillota bacterium]HOL10443.1 hypothetical protein [Bacillota bacterium]HPO98381.1 hypothetical protein [Bacillota bacterium]